MKYYIHLFLSRGCSRSDVVLFAQSLAHSLLLSAPPSFAKRREQVSGIESLTLSVALSENLYRTHFFSLPLPPSLPFSPSLSQAVAGLLQVDENEVRQSMCNRLITAGTDVMVKPETMEKASQARDALGKVCVGGGRGKERERYNVCACVRGNSCP